MKIEIIFRIIQRITVKSPPEPVSFKNKFNRNDPLKALEKFRFLTYNETETRECKQGRFRATHVNRK